MKLDIKILSENNHLLQKQIDNFKETDTKRVLSKQRDILTEFKQLASENIYQGEYLEKIHENIVSKYELVNNENKLSNKRKLLENLNTIKSSAKVIIDTSVDTKNFIEELNEKAKQAFSLKRALREKWEVNKKPKIVKNNEESIVKSKTEIVKKGKIIEELKMKNKPGYK